MWKSRYAPLCRDRRKGYPEKCFSCEKVGLENPQIFQTDNLKIFIPLKMPKAHAMGILNRLILSFK